MLKGQAGKAEYTGRLRFWGKALGFRVFILYIWFRVHVYTMVLTPFAYPAMLSESVPAAGKHGLCSGLLIPTLQWKETCKRNRVGTPPYCSKSLTPI